MNAQRKGDWLQTASGRSFWPLDPMVEDVFLSDIAHALSNICRFNGHCREFYSVAQHSVLVSRNVPFQLKGWGLMHDAAEAYVTDVPRPLKRLLPEFKSMESAVEKIVFEAFKLFGPMNPEVKRIDMAMLATEAEQIMLEPPTDWHLPELPLPIRIEPWPPAVAKRIFLQEFDLCRQQGLIG